MAEIVTTFDLADPQDAEILSKAPAQLLEVYFDGDTSGLTSNVVRECIDAYVIQLINDGIEQ